MKAQLSRLPEAGNLRGILDMGKVSPLQAAVDATLDPGAVVATKLLDAEKPVPRGLDASFLAEESKRRSNEAKKLEESQLPTRLLR